MTTLVVRLSRLAHAEGLPAPHRATAGSAGWDLHAALDQPLELAAGAFTTVPTGLQLEIPPGFEGQVRPRSGLAMRSGVTVLNAPGTIDSDYRGEVKVLLINHGPDPVTFERGDRIAQLVIAPVTEVRFEEIERLTESSRATGGFGSTGR